MSIPFGSHIALWLVLAVMATAGVCALLWLSLGTPELIGPKAPSAEDKFDLIKIALTATGGVGGVIFLVIAYRKQSLGELADRREDARENREKTKLFNERFIKSAEQLGHRAAAVRLAGVYAMAGLADDWVDQRQTCIDVLCAYLRMHYDPTQPRDPAELQSWYGERQVRHTLIRIIGAHLNESAQASWQGHDFDFTDAVFDGGDFSAITVTGGTVCFTGATFTGAKFTGAKFTGGIVHFNGAHFNGRVEFSGAKFAGSFVNFASAKFTSGEVYFFSAEFNGSVNFFGADFAGSTVLFTGARFVGGHTNFSGAKFVGGTVEFRGADFAGGALEFARPSAWEVPPRFDSWDSNTVPVGLRLPTSLPTRPHPHPTN